MTKFIKLTEVANYEGISSFIYIDCDRIETIREKRLAGKKKYIRSFSI